MEKEIRECFNNNILEVAANRFGYQLDELVKLNGFQNFVFEASGNKKPCIIRIAHSKHRTTDLVKAELDWINYLTDRGVSGARPVRSINNNLVEIIDFENYYFVVSAFEKAPGIKPNYLMYSKDKDFIRKLGMITGKIHALSKMYVIQSGLPRRNHWYKNHYLVNFSDYLPESYSTVIEKTNKFLEELTTLPKGKDEYGLIHGDIHLNNVHIQKNKLTLFDFDECEYSWFGCDIANPLFYATPLLSEGREARKEAAKHFYDCFMEGYFHENTIDEYWLKKIPQFLRLREILVYSGAFRSLDLNNLHPWSKEMIKNTTYNIIHDVPFLDIEFT